MGKNSGEISESLSSCSVAVVVGARNHTQIHSASSKEVEDEEKYMNTTLKLHEKFLFTIF